MIPLTDNDIMPFGKYKGMRMSDIPVEYLHWLWHQGAKNETETRLVPNYIKRCLSALKKENPDLIWT
jgi:uncharacterized protein (DUF3820 family)